MVIVLNCFYTGTRKHSRPWFCLILRYVISLVTTLPKMSSHVQVLPKKFEWSASMSFVVIYQLSWHLSTTDLLVSCILIDNVLYMVLCRRFNIFLIVKPTRCTNFSKFIFGMKFYMFWTGSGWNWVPTWSCSQAVSKPVWHIHLLCVQWKTPDDGQTNCPKHVEFHSKNKFWEISAFSWFYYKKCITMHGHMSVKFNIG